jgi:multidrug efflux system membrane fusion protein
MMARQGRLRLVLGALGVLAVGIVCWVLFHKPPAKPAKSPVAAVSVAKASVQDLPEAISALGAAQAWESDTILAQVTGMLQKVAFKEGTNVKAGQLLAQIDPSLYQAALDQAKGQLNRDQASLQDARLDLKRYQTLSAQNSIAGQQVDTQAALVKQDEGTVQMDTSPISGRTGVRLIDPGNLISASASATSASTTGTVTGSTSSGVTGIVVVNQIEPIAVTFSVPQRDYQRLSRLSDGFRKPLTTEALSQDSGASLGSGQLTIADNRVDPSTGTVEMKARFPNVGDKLLPGQFVNVRLTLQTLAHVTTIPAAAVNQGPNGPYAYVVGPDGKASMRPLKVRLTQGAIAVIDSGVNPGDTVVTDGQVALTNGMRVKVAGVATSSAKPAAP